MRRLLLTTLLVAATQLGFSRNAPSEPRPSDHIQPFYCYAGQAWKAVNGKPWNSVFLPYREIARGGKLVFTMGPRTNQQWGADSVLPKTE